MSRGEPPATITTVNKAVRTFHRGDRPAEDVISECQSLLQATHPSVRVEALKRILSVADASDTDVADIVDGTVAGLATATLDNKKLDLDMAADVSELYEANPMAFSRLLEQLEAIARREPGMTATNPLLAGVWIGDLGATKPGIIKRSIPALVEADLEEPLLQREVLAAIARIRANEPAVIRPFIATQIRTLDAEIPGAVAAAIQNLGVIGSVCPELVPPIETWESLLTHPSESVREQSARAVGRIGARAQLDEEWMGRPDLDAIADAHTWLGTALHDPETEVKKAALDAVERLVKADQSLAAQYADPIGKLAADIEDQPSQAVLSAIVTCVECGVLPDAATDAFKWGLTHFLKRHRRTAVRAIARAIKSGLFTDSESQYWVGLAVWSVIEKRRFDSGDDEILEELAEAIAIADLTGDVFGNISELLDTEHYSEIDFLPRALAAKGNNVDVICDYFKNQIVDVENRTTQEDLATGVTHMYEMDSISPDAAGSVAVEQIRCVEGFESHPAATLATLPRCDPVDDALHLLCERLLTEYESTANQDRTGYLAEAIEDIVTATPAAGAAVRDELLHLVLSPVVEEPRLANGLAHIVGADAISLTPIEQATIGRHAIRTDSTREEGYCLAILLQSEIPDWLRGAAILRFTECVGKVPTLIDAIRDQLDRDPHLATAVVNTFTKRFSKEVRDYVADNVSHPACAALTVNKIENSIPGLTSQIGEITPLEDLGEVSKIAPHVLSSIAASPDCILAYGQRPPLLGWLTAAENRGYGESIESFQTHADKTVRKQARALAEKSQEPATIPPTASVTSEIGVDVLARQLSAPTSAQETAVCKRLEDIAHTRPELRDRVVGHLLARVQGADKEERLSGVLDALDSLATTGAVVGRDRFTTTISQYLRDPSARVRRTALVVAASRSDRLDPDVFRAPGFYVELCELLTDPDPIVRELTARFIARTQSEYEHRDILIDRLRPLLIDWGAAREEALTALKSFSKYEPEALVPILPAIVDLVGDENEITSNTALELFIRVIDSIPAFQPACTRLPDVFDSDELPTPAFRALAHIDSSLLATIDDMPAILVHTLTATEDRDKAHLAATLLECLAREAPGKVKDQLQEAENHLADREIQIRVGEFGLYRAAAVVADTESASIITVFGDALESTLDLDSTTRGRQSNTEEAGRSLELHEVQAAAAKAASIAGHSSFLHVLTEYHEYDDTHRPVPENIARFLLRADSTDTDTALQALQDHYNHPMHTAVVEELADQNIANRRQRRKRLNLLESLLPRAGASPGGRAGLDTVITELSDSEWRTRYRAVETLCRIGATPALPADEALSHLLSKLSDDQSKVTEAVIDGLLNLCNRGEIGPTTLVKLLTNRATGTPPATAAAAAIAHVGLRYLRVRTLAVDRLAILLDDDRRVVRKAGVKALKQIAEVDDNAVGHLTDNLETLSASDPGPNVRHYADLCLSEITTD